MAWSSGKTLYGDRYIIEHQLGKGSFEITYLARSQNKQRVVIKTLNDGVQCTPEFPQLQQDFVNDALRLAICNHPHVVRVDEVFKEDALWCIVMKYISGENLDSFIMKRGILPESEALRYISQIGAALSVAHSRKLLHCHIKPNNILLRMGRGVTPFTREAVLIDFGLARHFEREDNHTPLIASPYAPIEQYFRGWRRGAYTDVYALAATLYVCLTKTLPQSALDRGEDIERGKSDPLVSPKQINPRISDRVNQAILKGMAFEAKHRPQSVQDWLALLRTENNALVLKINCEASELRIPDINLIQKIFKPYPVPPMLSSLSDRLDSDVGVDYSKLRDLLATGQWREAEWETVAVMLEAAGRKSEGWLDTVQIEKFPCTDLCTIDTLWEKYSKGRFGFSVQTRIWKSVEGTPDADYETWCAFGDRVGWRLKDSWKGYSNHTFTLKAPHGHLPGRCWAFCGEFGWGLFSLGGNLFSRIETCRFP